MKSADDATAGKALMLLIDYQVEARPASPIDLVEECRDIARRLLAGTPNLATLSQTASEFDAVVLQKQIERMSQSVETDPALAIGTAKELVETCCKTILMDRGASLPDQPDMSTLSKAVLKELQLAPEAIPDGSRGERVIKRLLSNLATVGNGLAELRGLYGTGHGPEAGTSGLQPRHARLAVKGVLPEDGLAAYGDDGDDPMLALVRKIVVGEEDRFGRVGVRAGAAGCDRGRGATGR